jgi:hypothetical protein
VHVDDAIETIVGLLQLDEIDDRTEVIAEMQIACRLDARKNPFNHRHRLLPTNIGLATSFATQALGAQVGC